MNRLRKKTGTRGARSCSARYLDLAFRLTNAAPAAVFEALPVLPLRRTLLAAEADFADVRITFFAICLTSFPTMAEWMGGTGRCTGLGHHHINTKCVKKQVANMQYVVIRQCEANRQVTAFERAPGKVTGREDAPSRPAIAGMFPPQYRRFGNAHGLACALVWPLGPDSAGQSITGASGFMRHSPLSPCGYANRSTVGEVTGNSGTRGFCQTGSLPCGIPPFPPSGRSLKGSYKVSHILHICNIGKTDNQRRIGFRGRIATPVCALVRNDGKEEARPNACDILRDQGETLCT